MILSRSKKKKVKGSVVNKYRTLSGNLIIGFMLPGFLFLETCFLVFLRAAFRIYSWQLSTIKKKIPSLGQC